MPPPTLEFAIEAKDYARGFVSRDRKKKLAGPGGYGSSNKLPSDMSEFENVGRMQERERMRNEAEIPHRSQLTLEFLKNYAAIVRTTERRGNCFELAVVAFAYAVEKDVKPVEIVSLKPPGDHSFVVLGRSSTISLNTPRELWPETIFICDPWANIACKARDYRAAWLARMQKWHDNKKRIAYSGKYIDPLTDDWLASIETHILEIDFSHRAG